MLVKALVDKLFSHLTYVLTLVLCDSECMYTRADPGSKQLQTGTGQPDSLAALPCRESRLRRCRWYEIPQGVGPVGGSAQGGVSLVGGSGQRGGGVSPVGGSEGGVSPVGVGPALCCHIMVIM